MGKYIEENLLNEESIVYEAKMHWFVYVPSIIVMLGGLILVGKEEPGVGGLVIFVSVVLMAMAWLEKRTTELGVTSKRVIAKYGIIQRHTTELNHSKVESFNVNQSIIARIFGCGTVTINGTGGVKTVMKKIDDPLQFRKKAMEVID